MADIENQLPRRSSRLRTGPACSSYDESSDFSNSKVTPLRIPKGHHRSKTLSAMTEDPTLKDISPGSSRRNSPSTFQIKEKMAAVGTSVKSLPSSPSAGVQRSEGTHIAREFWQKAANEEYISKRISRNVEGGDLKSLRSSYVKNNPFVAKDRESSPRLSMSPSQHRLSAQLGEITSSEPPPSTATPPRNRSSMDTLRKSVGSESSPKASCLHNARIKGPGQNGSDNSDRSPHDSRRERRKTVSFDEAPQVCEFDRRSSNETASSDRSSVATEDSDNKRDEKLHVGTRPLPSHPLPQIPPQDPEEGRPSSKDSDDSDYQDMEARIRNMMERAVLQDTKETLKIDHSDGDDIFSLYTTTNEMEDDEQQSQESREVFSSQGTESTALSSQDDEFDRHLALQKQSEELLAAVKSRPFSLSELPSLGFGDDGDDEVGTGLGLGEYCSAELEKSQPAIAPSSEIEIHPSGEAIVQQETQNAEKVVQPITPPLNSSASPAPQRTEDQTVPPLESLPRTPPVSPQKPVIEEDETEEPSPVVPESEATIRSRGGSKLRIRPSLSRQEGEAILSRRRKSELPPLPNLNDIREGSAEPEVKIKVEDKEDMAEFAAKFTVPKADVPFLKIERLGFEQDAAARGFRETTFEEMERRGYMMRQHSRVVHASSGGDEIRAARLQERMASSVSVEWGTKRAPQNPVRKPVSAPRKPSKDMSNNAPTPVAHAQKRLPSREVAPAQVQAPKKNASGEYGRLFIKVVKLKDLELLLPKDEPMYFSCTLDNGLHCVTTPFKLLQRESKIDQEFELIATEKLEFMLTLQARINLPPAPPKPKGTLGRGAFQRIFGSPKKKSSTPIPPPKDPYHGLAGIIGRDGSFARSYVALKTYENAAFGRQFTTDIACLNEWALEPAAVHMRGREVQKMRKRPYMIGKIECQLMFVPCVNPMEELPKSMSAAVREMKNAEWFSQLLWEGYLSQQGGFADIQHWRRRYFKLIGASLVGYHESTRARRATINLGKSTRVVDDRQSLIETPPPRARGQRRKSGFICEEAEGYMYLEEGFRIWFANGEVIDFRADTTEEKREWVNVLQGVVGKVPQRKEWAEAVLQKEKAAKR